MKAYVVVNTRVTNPEQIAEYRTLSGAAVAQYGGTFLARGGKFEVLEGGFYPERMVLIEFPSYEQAQKFYHSPEYQKAIAARKPYASFDMIVLEGL